MLYGRAMRWLLWLLGIALAAAIALTGVARYNARADPVVQRTDVALPGWPAGARPVTVALLSDVHLGSMAMDGARLTRVVDRVAALRPDLVVMAGDFIEGHRAGSATRIAPGLTAPFARLRPPLGAIAVLGNHDHWTGAAAVRRALEAAGVTVLENAVVARGPLAVGGVGDAFTHHDRLRETSAALRRLPGARVLLTHSPDIAPALSRDMPLLLAGHTHCGQVVLPLWGPIHVPSRYGTRYTCGIVREGPRTTVVTGGLGTSEVPLRLGAPPDIWLVRLGPGGRRDRK